MESATKEVPAVQLLPIDLSRKPEVYRASNPAYYGKWAIDFYPETIPTFASQGFVRAQDAVDWLILQFGREQVVRWFGGDLAVEAK